MLFRIYPNPLHFTSITRMTSIRGRGCPCRERTSKDLSGFLPLPESSHGKNPVNPSVKPSVAKYTEKDLQKILKTVLEAQVPPSHGPREKPLKARLPDIYCDKSHIKCYNFCQQCEDHFATAGAKSPNRFFLQHFSCMTVSTSVDSSTNGSMRLKAQSLSHGKSLKPFFVKA